MSHLLALYPEAWRARYGDEFIALLEDRPPKLRERFDIVRGALDAHVSPQLPGPDRVSDRAGLGAIVGFALFYVALVLALNGPEHIDEYGTYRDGMAAVPFFLLAMALLSIALFRTVLRLPPAKVGARAVGLIGLGCGLLWSMAPWLVPLLMIFLVGVVVVAVAAYRAGLWPVWLPVLLALCVVAPLVIGVVQLMLPWYALRQAGFNFLIIFVPISGLWLVYGIGLLRGFTTPPRASAEAQAG
jgi:hypothetical protein